MTDAVALGLPLLIALIAVALLFDFLNGLHDAANSIATIVSTRVLPPQAAVAWAAFFNFVAFAVFGLHVARTLGTGIVGAQVVDAAVIFGALLGAIVWNVLAWQASMALGTLLGGWRIVHTMGSRITRLMPTQGFCAETGGAATLFLATWLGVPVSTTHTITGAVIGVGSARRLSAVRWNVA